MLKRLMFILKHTFNAMDIYQIDRVLSRWKVQNAIVYA